MTIQLFIYASGREEYLRFIRTIEQLNRIAKTLNCDKIFLKYYGYTELAVRGIKILCIGVAITTASNPIFIKLLSGELALPYGFLLPFIDPMTTSGYAINYIYSFGDALSDGTYVFVYDTLILITIFPIYASYDALVELLERISEKRSEIKDKMQLKIKLKEIFMLHQMIVKFIEDLEKYFKYMFCVATYIYVTICVSSIFALITVRFYVGITIFGALMIQLLFLCIYGQVLENKQIAFKNKLAEIAAIDMPKEVRKDLPIALICCKKVRHFTCIFRKLNFETFLDVSLIWNRVEIFNLSLYKIYYFYYYYRSAR